MTATITPRLRAYAEVVVRVGLNLRPGQRLLLAEPYELQGVARDAADLVAAVSAAARAAGATDVDVLWGDAERTRAAAGRRFDPEFDEILHANAARMRAAVQRGEALLFLQGSHPRLLDGLTPQRVARFRERCWAHYGPIAQGLVAGRTNWTAAPAPTPAWAEVVFPGQSPEAALAALWEAVFSICRIGDASDVLGAWRSHLAALRASCERANERRAPMLRYRGDGTDLTVRLPADHVWCTAELGLASGAGGFVANLPTEEVFTAPDRQTAEGVVRIARPVAYGGSVIDGIELEFRVGRVVRSSARRGHELLQRILATDEGASRLGEVAIVPARDVAATGGAHLPPLFFHPLLDENALNHIALGEGYRFCVGEAGARQLNRSLIHLDLPVEAAVEWGG